MSRKAPPLAGGVHAETRGVASGPWRRPHCNPVLEGPASPQSPSHGQGRRPHAVAVQGVEDDRLRPCTCASMSREPAAREVSRREGAVSLVEALRGRATSAGCSTARRRQRSSSYRWPLGPRSRRATGGGRRPTPTPRAHLGPLKWARGAYLNEAARARATAARWRWRRSGERVPSRRRAVRAGGLCRARYRSKALVERFPWISGLPALRTWLRILAGPVEIRAHGALMPAATAAVDGVEGDRPSARDCIAYWGGECVSRGNLPLHASARSARLVEDSGAPRTRARIV